LRKRARKENLKLISAKEMIEINGVNQKITVDEKGSINISSGYKI